MIYFNVFYLRRAHIITLIFLFSLHFKRTYNFSKLVSMNGNNSSNRSYPFTLEWYMQYYQEETNLFGRSI